MYIKSFGVFLNEHFFDYHNIYESFNYLDFEILENGNLKIILNREGKEKVEDDGIDEYKFSDYFEDIQSNSDYMYYDDISDTGLGMSNSPSILDGYYYDDDDKLKTDYDDSMIWIYNDYMIKDFTKELVEDGFVIFQNTKSFTPKDVARYKAEKIKQTAKKYNIL